MDKPKESICVNYREGLKKARIELFKKTCLHVNYPPLSTIGA